MRRVANRRLKALEVRKLLTTAHEVCYMLKPDILSMSSGPFSGVNKVLGLVASLDFQLSQYENRDRMREIKEKQFRLHSINRRSKKGEFKK